MLLSSVIDRTSGDLPLSCPCTEAGRRLEEDAGNSTGRNNLHILEHPFPIGRFSGTFKGNVGADLVLKGLDD